MNDSAAPEPRPAPPVRVMVVDDHPMMRAGITASLVAAGGIEVVAEAADGDAAIEAFGRTRPDVALVDLAMPGKDGLATIGGIRALYPGARLIALTTYRGDARIAATLRAGARAYLTKDATPAELAGTVQEVHEGRYVHTDALRAQIDFHYRRDPLSARELEVLHLVACGRSNREIAGVLSVAETTVKSHMASILRKLQASDRAHAVTLGLRRGFIQF